MHSDYSTPPDPGDPMDGWQPGDDDGGPAATDDEPVSAIHPRDLETARAIDAGRDEPSASTTPGDAWPELQPLEIGGPPPPLPLDVLTPWVREYVQAVAASTTFAEDMGAAFALGAVSVALRGRLHVHASADWREPVQLYVAVVAPPSEGKSPVFSKCFGPLHGLDARRMEEAAPRVAEEAALRAVDEMRLKSLQAELVKAEGDERLALEETMREVAARLSQPCPVVPRMLITDCTPERLCGLLAEQGERLGIATAEDTMLSQLAGRYSRHPAIEVYLSAWSAEHLSIDRQGKAPIILRTPALTICAAMQPVVLEGQGAKLADDRGLLARFLYVRPPTRTGYRDLRHEPPSIPAAVARRYHDRLVNLAETFSCEDSTDVELDMGGGRAAFRRWRVHFEERRRDGAAWAPIGAWAGKAESHLLRLAGILWAADGADVKLGAEHVDRAGALVDALALHALSAIGTATAEPSVRLASRLLAWCSRASVATFTSRDAARALHCTVGELAAAIRVLVDHGHLRRERWRESERAKWSERFRVHPEALR